MHDEFMNIISVCSNQSLNRFSYWKTAHVQLHAVSHSLLFGVLSFGVENWSFMATESPLTYYFAFGLSVGWKLVRKYASY